MSQTNQQEDTFQEAFMTLFTNFASAEDAARLDSSELEEFLTALPPPRAPWDVMAAETALDPEAVGTILKVDKQ